MRVIFICEGQTLGTAIVPGPVCPWDYQDEVVFADPDGPPVAYLVVHRRWALPDAEVVTVVCQRMPSPHGYSRQAQQAAPSEEGLR